MTTTIEAMKQADHVLASVYAVSPDSVTPARVALQKAIAAEEAQTVEPDHFAGISNMVSGERDVLIKQLRDGQKYDYSTGYLLDMSSIMDDAADMLAADAQTIPDGYALVPIKMTPAMSDIADRDDWQWADILAAAEAITEGQYDEAMAQQVAVPQEPNNNEVICPNCCTQFRAIPVDVQQLMLDAGFEPPFTAAPQSTAQKSGDAHEIWAAAQLVPGEGIEDGVARVEALLDAPRVQP